MRASDVQKDIGLQFLFVEPVLYEIADADETYEPPFFHDRQMTDAVCGHDCHHVVDPILRHTSGNIGRHQLMDFVVESSHAIFGKCADHVAVGKHARKPTPTIKH